MATLLQLDQIADQIVDRTGDQLVTGHKKILSHLTVQSGFLTSGAITGDPPFRFVDQSTYHISLFSGHETGCIDGRTVWQTAIGALSHRTVGGDSASGFLQIAGSGGIVVAPGDIGSLSNTVLITTDLSGSDVSYDSNHPALDFSFSGEISNQNSGDTGTYFPLNTSLRWSDQVGGLIQTGMGRLFELRRDDLAAIDFGHSGATTTTILNINATQTGDATMRMDFVLSCTGEDRTKSQLRVIERTGVRSTVCSTSTPGEFNILTADHTGINIFKPLVLTGAGDYKASGIILRDVTDGDPFILLVSGDTLRTIALS